MSVLLRWLLCGVVLVGASAGAASAAPMADLADIPAATASMAGAIGLQRMALAAEPFEETVGGWAASILRGVRRFVRSTVVTIRQAFKAWGRYARRAIRFVLIAVLFALADRNLIAAWRANGLGVLATYIPLMLYVYVRLLFDRRVPAWPKLFLFGALAYGVLRRDLIPDRAFVPGQLEDVLLIFLAVRLLLRWCTDEVLNSIAAEAVNWRRRVVSFQRARQR